MRLGECPREAELLEALQAAWPDDCPEDLRDHLAGCSSCRTVAEAALPILAEHRASIAEACVPSPAAMWWRLEMRARRDAQARAMRPIAAVQAITLASGLGLLAALAGWFVPGAASAAARLAALAGSAALAGAASLPSTAAQLLSPGGIALGLAGALLFVAAPVAIYLALSDR